MPISIDQIPTASQWSEQDINLFNKLPYYLAKQQVKYIQNYNVWQKLLKSQPWTPKSGTLMKSVRKEPTPILRADFYPNSLQTYAKRDILEQAEMTEVAMLYHHKVESQLLHFLPDFQDFLDNVDSINDDIAEKITYLPDAFYETFMWNCSPHVYVCGSQNPLHTDAPCLGNTTGVLQQVKSTNWVKSMLAECQGTLDFKNLDRAVQGMYSSLRATPWSGGVMPDGTDGSFLTMKYTLVSGIEFWDGLRYDPYVLAYKPLDSKVVAQGWQGQINNKVICRTKNYEWRFDVNGNLVAPETQENPITSNSYNKGETVINPNYDAAPYALAWLVGDTPYKVVKPGPPPAPFSSGTMSIDRLNGLDWNGKVDLTRDVMIKIGVDGSGNPIYDTNKYGEYAQAISRIAMGIIPVRRRNILPIIYARARVSVKN